MTYWPPTHDAELRHRGLGSLTFALDDSLGGTSVPTGTGWTLLKAWEKTGDTFLAKTAAALGAGTVQRHPRAYWGAIVTSSVLQVTDTGLGGATWEIAFVLGLDLVNNPTVFSFPPLPFSPTTVPQNGIIDITFPNAPIIPFDFAPFAGSDWFDAAVAVRHDDTGSRTLTPVLANSTYVRMALFSNPIT